VGGGAVANENKQTSRVWWLKSPIWDAAGKRTFFTWFDVQLPDRDTGANISGKKVLFI
jgi:hypothetical protein